MNLRELKALEIAARSKLTFSDGVWHVPSQAAPRNKHRVSLDPVACTCEDFHLTQKPASTSLPPDWCRNATTAVRRPPWKRTWSPSG